MCGLYIGAYLMESSYFDKIPESELIEKLSDTSKESSEATNSDKDTNS